ncbi:MAG: ABC transporter permease [Bacteriovoracaceae bacterium]|nr:ABC transporter permease [Bacteriovoracaceae bacterium]
MWSQKPLNILYATGRMLLQLTLVGFVLTFIFKTQNIFIIGIILLVMTTTASWIALRPVAHKRKETFFKAFISLLLVGLSFLAFIIFVVIRPKPWYLPTYLIPLAGMIFSNSMNTMSLSAERFMKEIENGTEYEHARKIAWRTGLIPLTNTFLAVGLVSLPGMMTGQILAGIDPLIAVRYQILVMAILYGAGGLSTALFLYLLNGYADKNKIA